MENRHKIHIVYNSEERSTILVSRIVKAVNGSIHRLQELCCYDKQSCREHGSEEYYSHRINKNTARLNAKI